MGDTTHPRPERNRFRFRGATLRLTGVTQSMRACEYPTGQPIGQAALLAKRADSYVPDIIGRTLVQFNALARNLAHAKRDISHIQDERPALEILPLQSGRERPLARGQARAACTKRRNAGVC
jgi:hypothetical protein